MIDANTLASMTDTIITDIHTTTYLLCSNRYGSVTFVGLLVQPVTQCPRRSLCIRCFFWLQAQVPFPAIIMGGLPFLRPVQYAHFCGPRRSTFNYISPLMCW